MSRFKSFRRKTWTLQCYWPALFTGPSVFGVKADSALIFNRYGDGAWAFGFSLLGFGLGLMREPRTAGVREGGNG